MLAKLQAWWAQPFSSNQSVIGWALFLLMLVVIMAFWRLILGHIISGVD